MTMPLTTSPRQGNAEGQATYGMANLRSQRTGLPFIVFISQKDDAKHAARVKVAPGPKMATDEMGSYAIAPFGYKAGRRLAREDERRLELWVDLNRPVIQAYWDGAIEYTEDALDRLERLS